MWGGETFRKAVEAFRAYIDEETLADTLTVAENDGCSTEIGEETVSVTVKKA